MMYVIGVDGGGTKTEAVAYDLHGNRICSALTGFGNLLNNKDEALQNVISAVENIATQLKDCDLQGIYLGLAGSEVANNSKIVYDEIQKLFNTKVKVMNDSELALKALLKGEDGILTIAGTGSISFGINNDIQWKAGGWGHLLGDEGSAYKIAIESIKNMIQENDNNMELGELSLNILEFLDIKSPDEIIEFVYSSTKDEVAKLAVIVSKLAHDGDEKARNILISEAKLLGETTRQVFSKLNFSKCSVGLVGGVVKRSIIFREVFENYLNERVDIVSYIDEDVSPAKGAYYIHKKESC
ncbi:MAG: N-acetylglucosamine kinase [Sarcina sp.]